VVIDQFGTPAHHPSIGEALSDLPVVLDAACSLGATVDGAPAPSFGVVACPSFHPRKLITTGEGGACLTDDAARFNRRLARVDDLCRACARNGQEALEASGLNRPDLVLLDINMPVMDGMDTLDHLCRDDPDVLVIMLTSLATRELVESSAAKGAIQFIRKDVPRANMSRVLQETFDEYFE